MRVLVTGGHGFIGSHVLRQLVDDDHTVACFDINEPSAVAEPVADEVTFFKRDVTDPVDVYGAIAAFDPDRIIHLASLLGRASQADPREAFAINVGGTINVLEAACDLGATRVVAASSVSSYGPVSGLESFDETAVQQPQSIYGLTKYVVERVGATYQDQRGIEFAALEPVHGLGPDRRRGNVEDAYVIKAAVSGAPLTVPRIEHPLELVYVGDEASAFIAVALADALAHDRYLVTSGERITLVDFIDVVRERVPEAEFEIGEPPAQELLHPRPPTDTTRLRDDTEWEPTLSIEEMVDTYIEWLRDHPDAWSFDPDDAPWSSPS